MNFSDLPTDIYHNICPFLTNEEIYHLLTMSKGVSSISGMYLQPQLCNNRAIRISCREGNISAVRKLLQHPKVNPSNNDNKPIAIACMAGHTEIVRLLLSDPRVDPTTMDNGPIRLSSRYGHVEIVKLLLLDPRIDPTTNNNEALMWASRKGYREIAELLLSDHRIGPLSRDGGEIVSAITNDHFDVAEIIIKYGKITHPTSYVKAMHTACVRGSADIVRLLLSNSETNLSTNGNRAINVVSRCNDDPDVVLPQDERIDPSADDNEAIILASKYGNSEIVKLLLQDKRVDPSARDNMAIRSAFEGLHRDVVGILYRDPRMRDCGYFLHLLYMLMICP